MLITPLRNLDPEGAMIIHTQVGLFRQKDFEYISNSHLLPAIVDGLSSPGGTAGRN